MEGDNLALQRAYLRDRSEAQQPLVAVVEGRIEVMPAMEGDDRATLRIERTVGVVPTLSCERAMADSELENMYWRILSMEGAPIEAPGMRREASIRFLGQDRRFSATVGCNTINGAYDLDGSKLSLAPGPMTMMACPPPLDAIERRFTELLGTVAELRVTGPTAELLDSKGEALLFMEAVALP
jgi:heat shock protein HslJ